LLPLADSEDDEIAEAVLEATSLATAGWNEDGDDLDEDDDEDDEDDEDKDKDSGPLN
jgi:hypothetical protein